MVIAFNIKLENASNNIPSPSEPCSRKKIELAICLYDFDPQKSNDLGFKAGERIMIESRTETANWWFGSIGERKGWFPKNYVQLKELS